MARGDKQIHNLTKYPIRVPERLIKQENGSAYVLPPEAFSSSLPKKVIDAMKRHPALKAAFDRGELKTGTPATYDAPEAQD